jgi:hypothetical protein
MICGVKCMCVFVAQMLGSRLLKIGLSAHDLKKTITEMPRGMPVQGALQCLNAAALLFFSATATISE